MTAPTPEVDGSLVELLAAHRLVLSQPEPDGWRWGCTCTEWGRALGPAPSIGARNAHERHLARVVQGWADERVAGALEGAAVALEVRRAEVYAEIGRDGRGKWSRRRYAGGLTEAIQTLRGER